jgi:hypothetical protein
MRASLFEEAFSFEPHRHIDAHSYDFLWFNVNARNIIHPRCVGGYAVGAPRTSKNC